MEKENRSIPEHEIAVPSGVASNIFDQKLSNETGLAAGEELANACISSVTKYIRENVFTVISLQQIKDALISLPHIDTTKFKSRFENIIEEAFREDALDVIHQNNFMNKLNLLAKLEAKSTKHKPARQITEDMNEDELYRPHRVQFLKDEIRQMESRILEKKLRISFLKKWVTEYQRQEKEIEEKTVAFKEKTQVFNAECEEVDTKIKDARQKRQDMMVQPTTVQRNFRSL